MSNQEVINSYQENFKSCVGAYAYMMLNQQYPELFVINSDVNRKIKATPLLEKALMNCTDINQLEKEIEKINPELLELSSMENSISQDKILMVISNMKYLQTNWDWETLNGLIDYNNFSPYMVNKDKLSKELDDCAKQFSFKSIALNPNFYPFEFLNDLTSGANTMCQLLNMKPSQIGMETLRVNYQTEEGDFTGYMGNDDGDDVMNHMVIKKVGVFAHEWMHFIDSSLGTKGWNLTAIMEKFPPEEFKSYFEHLSEMSDFIPQLNKKEDKYSSVEFSDSIVSASHFLSRYALNKETFSDDIKTLAEKFAKDPKKNSQTKLINAIKELVHDNHPPRYFSFIEAQCEIYKDKINKKELKSNQLINFSKKADTHLGESNYTESVIELFARTFETYLDTKTKLIDKKCALIVDSYESDLYPQAEIKTNLNNHWDKMWLQIKKELDNIMSDDKQKIDKKFILSNIEKLRGAMPKDMIKQKKPFNI